MCHAAAAKASASGPFATASGNAKTIATCAARPLIAPGTQPLSVAHRPDNFLHLHIVPQNCSCLLTVAHSLLTPACTSSQLLKRCLLLLTIAHCIQEGALSVCLNCCSQQLHMHMHLYAARCDCLLEQHPCCAENNTAVQPKRMIHAVSV